MLPPRQVFADVTQRLIRVHWPVVHVPVAAQDTPISVWSIGHVAAAVIPTEKLLH